MKITSAQVSFYKKKKEMFTSHNIPLPAFNPSGPGGNKKSYILKERAAKQKLHICLSMCSHWIPRETHLYVCVSEGKKFYVSRKIAHIYLNKNRMV